MKDRGGIICIFVFLAISLFAANAFMANADFRIGFEPRMAKSILNLTKNENTFTAVSDNKSKDEEDNSKGEIDIRGEESHKEGARDDKSKGERSAESGCGYAEDKNSENERDGAGKGAVRTSAVAAGASGKALIEQSSKRLLFGVNEHEKCYPASTTKILTAYIALKNLPLDHVVVIPKEAAGVEGSSIYLKAGEQVTVEDLLYGLMLRSGNDAATALALEVAGSIEAFADMMNLAAREMGAYESHFVNPHGLHDDDHYTTAYDLALITAESYELDDFRRIVSTTLKRIEIDGAANSIVNKNKLLKLYGGANGVKTGYTKKSGRCLVGGAERDGMQLISVVLNCPDMWNDSMDMLNFGFENFRMIPLDSALLTWGEGKKRVETIAPYNVTSDWKDIYYPIAKDEYLVVNAA